MNIIYSILGFAAAYRTGYFNIYLHYEIKKLLIWVVRKLCVFQGANLIQSKVALPGPSSDLPVKAFVQLEHYTAVSLVQTVHRSLAQLSKVIRGTLLLTSEVQKLAESLLRQEVRVVTSQAVWLWYIIKL